MHNVYSREYMAYWIFDFPRIYIRGLFPCCPSVRQSGGWIFHFSMGFPISKTGFSISQYGFFVPNTIHILPPYHGARKVCPFLSRSISRCRCLCSCDPGDRRPAQRVQTATGRAWQSVCVAFAERGQSVRAGAVTAADSRLTAGPLQSPCPSRRLAYSSSVVRAHNVRGG